MAMDKNLSGIYRSCWKWEYGEKLRTYESITVLFHHSKHSIIGFEIYDGNDGKKCKNYGGLYFLFGKVEGTTIKGKWQKLNSPEYGNFTLPIKDLKGKYNHLHPKAPHRGKNYSYKMRRLIEL